jgi:thioredoxin reductase (NADPH)
VNLVLVLSILAIVLVLLDLLGRWQRGIDGVERERILAEVREAEHRGTDRPIAQHPQIDVQRCIGCGSCVEACPESGVLGIVDGVARVIHGARCIGHARCADVCPVNAIVVGLGDVSARSDLPLLSPTLETTVPGVKIAGELGGMGLIRIATEQGARAMAEFAKELRAAPFRRADTFDVLVVGTGPAGFAALLQAKQEGLRAAAIDRDDLGGTVRKYPRRKLTLTGPLVLPIHGRVDREEFLKEELIEFWQGLAARHGLQIHSGLELTGLTGAIDDFTARTTRGSIRARRILLALGRRGTPRKLGVPGEELEKVLYQLVDAATVHDEKILVVGGGDSAIESAVMLAEEADTIVTLSYRSAAFNRAKRKNRQRLEEATASGRLTVLLESTVTRVDADADAVELEQRGKTLRIRNDAVIVNAGGILPTPFLKELGIEVETKFGTR